MVMKYYYTRIGQLISNFEMSKSAVGVNCFLELNGINARGVVEAAEIYRKTDEKKLLCIRS